jgi:hypothetical protein
MGWSQSQLHQVNRSLILQTNQAASTADWEKNRTVGRTHVCNNCCHSHGFKPWQKLRHTAATQMWILLDLWQRKPCIRGAQPMPGVHNHSADRALMHAVVTGFFQASKYSAVKVNV